MQILPYEPAPRRALTDRLIEWEALPSLAYLIGRGHGSAENAPVWADTMPSEFDAQASEPPAEFAEPLPGLEMREVHEPEIFRLFFAS
jgi:hypothetical protein